MAFLPKGASLTNAVTSSNDNGLIIDVLLENGPQRFVELAAKIPMVSDRVLDYQARSRVWAWRRGLEDVGCCTDGPGHLPWMNLK